MYVCKRTFDRANPLPNSNSIFRYPLFMCQKYKLAKGKNPSTNRGHIRKKKKTRKDKLKTIYMKNYKHDLE